MLSSSWDGWLFGRSRHGPKSGGWVPFGGQLGPPFNTMLPAPRLYQMASWSIEPFGRNIHGPKSGVGCCASFLGSRSWVSLRPHLTQCHLGRGLPSYQVAPWSIQPYGHNRHKAKIGGGAVSLWAGYLCPHLTIWPGLRPTSMPSFILIHSTVLQTVAQKSRLVLVQNFKR